MEETIYTQHNQIDAALYQPVGKMQVQYLETGEQTILHAVESKLKARLYPANQTEVYREELRNTCRRQKEDETLTKLGQAIRRLTQMAYSSPSQSYEKFRPNIIFFMQILNQRFYTPSSLY